MSKSAGTLNVTERQKILRLLVKEIHVGPDTPTINLDPAINDAVSVWEGDDEGHPLKIVVNA